MRSDGEFQWFKLSPRWLRSRTMVCGAQEYICTEYIVDISVLVLYILYILHTLYHRIHLLSPSPYFLSQKPKSIASHAVGTSIRLHQDDRLWPGIVFPVLNPFFFLGHTTHGPQPPLVADTTREPFSCPAEGHKGNAAPRCALIAINLQNESSGLVFAECGCGLYLVPSILRSRHVHTTVYHFEKMDSVHRR